jgi:hypothetical protein
MAELALCEDLLRNDCKENSFLIYKKVVCASFHYEEVFRENEATLHSSWESSVLTLGEVPEALLSRSFEARQHVGYGFTHPSSKPFLYDYLWSQFSISLSVSRMKRLLLVSCFL